MVSGVDGRHGESEAAEAESERRHVGEGLGEEVPGRRVDPRRELWERNQITLLRWVHKQERLCVPANLSPCGSGGLFHTG